MPRPDIAALGVEYRRIPIMAIGRDIYHDTRLILRKLEQLFPGSDAHPAISASDPEQRGIEKLLELWIIDGGVFARGSQLLPTSLPLMKDVKFTKDREEYTGVPWSKDAVEAKRPEALVEMKNAFALLEDTLLADGREWVLKTQSPSLADIEGIVLPIFFIAKGSLLIFHSCLAVPLDAGDSGSSTSGLHIRPTIPQIICLD